MFNINKIKSYLNKIFIRIQLENFLKVASAQIPSGSFVLDFALSANKYSYIFKHTIVNFLYGDSEYIYSVINNVIRITKEDEINLKDI